MCTSLQLPRPYLICISHVHHVMKMCVCSVLASHFRASLTLLWVGFANRKLSTVISWIYGYSGTLMVIFSILGEFILSSVWTVTKQESVKKDFVCWEILITLLTTIDTIKTPAQNIKKKSFVKYSKCTFVCHEHNEFMCWM